MLQAVGQEFGLAMDATAVSGRAHGLAGRPCELRRVAADFGGFQAGMATVGWLAGSAGEGLHRGVDHWSSFRPAWCDRARARSARETHHTPAAARASAPAQASMALYPSAWRWPAGSMTAAAGLTLPLVPAPPWLFAGANRASHRPDAVRPAT